MTTPAAEDTAHERAVRFAVVTATLVAFAMIAQQVAATATRDAFFLSHYPATDLPPVMAASVALSFLVVISIARLVTRFSPARIAPAFFAVNGAVFAGEWLLSMQSARIAAVAVFLHTAALGAAVISCFWSVVSERFDPHTAKKVISRIAGGASLGGIVGGAAAFTVGRALPLTTMLPILAGINAVCAVGLLRVGGGGHEEIATGPEGEKATSGFSMFKLVPYLRQLALLIVLSAFVEVTVDYVFKARASDRFATSEQLISFFAIFYTAMGVVSFALQTALAKRLLDTLGLVGTAATRAVSVTIGNVAALLFPGIWSVMAVRGSEGALKSSLFRSGYELLYTPLAAEKKRPTKTIIDVGCNRVGGLAGIGVAMIAIAAAPAVADEAILAAAFAAALVTLLVLNLLQRGYVAALAESLHEGKVKLDKEEIADATTRKTWVESTRAMRRDVLLRELAARRRRSGEQAAATDTSLLDAIAELLSGDAARIRKALRSEPDVRVAAHLIDLLGQREVQAEAAHALEAVGGRVTGQLIDALLDPKSDRVVRRNIPRVLAAHPSQRAADGLLLGLDDSSLGVRIECGAALARIREADSSVDMPRDVVVAAATRAAAFDERGRAAERSLDHVFTLLSLILDRQPLQLAYRALRSDDPRLHGTGIEYLHQVLPQPVREALWPRLGVGAVARPAARKREEIADDLRRSFAVPREVLESRRR